MAARRRKREMPPPSKPAKPVDAVSAAHARKLAICAPSLGAGAAWSCTWPSGAKWGGALAGEGVKASGLPGHGAACGEPSAHVGRAWWNLVVGYGLPDGAAFTRTPGPGAGGGLVS